MSAPLPAYDLTCQNPQRHYQERLWLAHCGCATVQVTSMVDPAAQPSVHVDRLGFLGLAQAREYAAALLAAAADAEARFSPVVT